MNVKHIIARCALAALLVAGLSGAVSAQGTSNAASRQVRAQELVASLLALPASDPQWAGKAAALKAQLDVLKADAAAARADLAAQRSWLQSKALPASVLTRQAQFEAEFNQRATAFERAASAWQADGAEQRLRELDQFLKQHPAGKTRAAPGNGPLPWGAIKHNKRQPAETKAAWWRRLTRDERVQLAQAGLTTVGGVRFSTLPEPDQAPQDADLAESADVQLSAAIRAKAQELGGSPVNILNWVRANVQYVPTWGAVQGADATLRQRRGNAIDTASLTIALLRASGIPARYQFGTVDVPLAVAQNWMGGVSQPEAVLQLLAQGGIAARGVSEAGEVKAIRMEHAWVSAYVHWAPHRGARYGGAALVPPQHASPNAQLNAWIPLDAAYKQHQFSAGLNLAELAPFNAAGALDAVRQGASCSAASAAQLDAAALAAHYAQFTQQAQQQLGASSRVGQILPGAAIANWQHPLLAGTLAFPTVTQDIALAAAPPALRWRLQLALQSGADTVLALDKSLPELQGRALVLAFVPETEADAQTLASLLRPGTGGDAATGLPLRAAAYLVRLKAQLRLDGQLVAEGGSFTLGQPLALRTLLQNPEGNAAASESALAVGETHAWAVQGQMLGAAAPAAAAQALDSLRAQLQGSNPPDGSTQAQALLQGAAAAYQASLDAKAGLYQRAGGAVEVRLPAVVRASSRLESEEAFGLITHVRAAGAGLHADRLGSAVAARSAAGAPGYARQSLERASAEAHHLLDRLFGPAGGAAQSAVSGLSAAAAQGQTLWRADAATLPQVLAALDPDSTVRAQIEHAVANGQQALLAQSHADLGGLPMDPLVLLDAQAGTAAYSVTSRALPLVQLSAQRPGLAGWLGLADAQASQVIATPALQAAIAQLNTAQTLLGDPDNQLWQGFAGQAEVLHGLYASRLAEAASTAQACDWAASLLASQLATGLPSMPVLNRAPVIASVPVTTAQAEGAYSYAVQASDADGDALVFTLSGAPSGMSISAAGLIHWPRAVAGQFALLVQVSDGKALAQQPFTLTVGAPAAGLNVGLALQPSIADAGQTVTLSVSASSPAGTVTRSATLAGVPLPLDAQGMAVFTAPAAGAHPIVVTASDGKNTVTREVILTVRDAADTAAPSAVITSPQEDASLRGVANIVGSATDARFAYYQLLLRRVGEGDAAWREIGRGLAPVSNGVLGQLDTSTHDNGHYQIALRVVDVNGAQSVAAVTVEFIGNLKLGQFRLSFADVRAEAPGLPLMLTRTYDSTKKDVMGDFGWGWSASGEDITVRKNVTLGVQWEVQQRQFQLCLVPLGKRRISISLPDGGLYRFDAKNFQECAFGQVPQVDIQFNPVPGPTGGPAGRVSAGAQLRAIDGALVMAQGGMLVDADTGEPWNPKDFELTTEEGFKYQLREGVGILNVTDPYGNRVTYGAGGYNHSANLSVSLTRDGQGRITRATDPNGKAVTYTYNGQGELESVTDRDGQVTRFAYATVSGANTGTASGNQDVRHLLASITDPRGQVVMSNQFDAYGRLTGTADALGQAATQEYDLANSKQVVTDRRGNRTVYTFDADGNITELVNALNEKTSFAFDANGNETEVVNALGHKTKRSFDALTGKQQTETNPLEHSTRIVYPGFGLAWQRLNPSASVDARGHTTSFAYPLGQEQQPGAVPASIGEPLGRSTSIGQDSKGNLKSLNIAGEALSFEYDDKGRKTKETNGLGHVTTWGYDALGNETSRSVTKTVNGQSVSFTTTKKYDAENRLIEETDALGGKRLMTYNAAGKLASQTDSLGRVTTYSYDANARLTKTEYPDGTSEATEYDAGGNETGRTDRAGRITRMEYDALNRLVATRHPDGSSETTEFDAAGRVEHTIDRRGKKASFEYDDAGRQTASVDASGIRTEQTFDENGNRKTVSVDGRTTSFEYDALNRLTKTTWPDGSTHSTTYRPDNRKQSETDQRGVTTSYGWDAAGRLSSVAQSLSATATATTTYGYDETGAKVRQIDALGRTTTWSIDGNGRITARQIQDGSKETSSYDSEGNRLAKTTFAGERLTYQYDSQGRLTSQVVPQGTGGNSTIAAAVAAFSYSASGQLLIQQEQGATTLNGTQSLRYDADGRPLQLTNPIGQISWALDAAGNVIERSASAGEVNAGTVKYEHDDAGRLKTVIAPDGKQARYTYDNAGRLVTIERDLNAKDGQPQVLVTYQRYDSADRMIVIANVIRHAGAGTVAAGQAITRTTGGTIERIDTFQGGNYDSASGQFAGTPATTQAFEYDKNSRLTRETRSKDGNTTDTAYEYDAAGNRTKKTVTTAAGAEVTTYGYDSADRLTSESTTLAAGGTRAVTYTWDGNGNLASKTKPGKTTLHRFDPRNRLIDIRVGSTLAEAQAATPSVSYAYDAKGNRVRKTTSQGTTGYLVDPKSRFAQVAMESRRSEALAYVFAGEQLIRQTKVGGSAAEDLIPLRGHLGTNLGAIDANGNLVEQVDSDAFGNIDQPTGLKQTHLYTGQYWDQDAQLLYLRARWYDPESGRFISPDPFQGRQQDPRSLHRYVYAHNSPVSNTDPTGRMSMGEISIGISVGATLGLAAQTLVGGLYNTYVGPNGRPTHYYEGRQIRICSQCTPQQVYQAMLNMPAPKHFSPDVGAPVQHGEMGYAGWTVFPGGPVYFYRNDPGLTLVNQTNQYHILHNGSITRTAMYGMGGVTIKTIGQGDNHTAFIARANEIVGKKAFEGLDESIRNSFSWLEAP